MKFGKASLTIVFEDNNLISDYVAPLKDLQNNKLSFLQHLEINAHIFYSGMIKENVPKYHSEFNILKKTLTINTLGALRSRSWIDQEYAEVLDFIFASCNIYIGESTLRSDGLITSFLVDKNGEHLLKKHFRNKDRNQQSL